MARQEIDLTTPQPNGKMGEPTKSAWEKVNEMTLELYAPRITVGTYGNRPLYSANVGTEYYATDTKELYYATASGWIVLPSGGSELGFSSRNTSFITTSQSFVDVPSLTVSFVAGERPSLVEWGATITVASGIAVLALFVDGVQIGQVLNGGTSTLSLSSIARINNKTPGSTVTAKLMARSTGAASLTILGDQADQSRIRVSTT